MGIISLQSSIAISGAEQVTEIRIIGNYAYIFTHTSTTENLLIYDISSPLSPSLISTTLLKTHVANAFYRAHVAVYGNYLFYDYKIDVYSFLLVINISNPLSPSVVTEVTGYGYSCYVFSEDNGSYLYQIRESLGSGICRVFEFVSPNLLSCSSTWITTGISNAQVVVTGFDGLGTSETYICNNNGEIACYYTFLEDRAGGIPPTYDSPNIQSYISNPSDALSQTQSFGTPYLYILSGDNTGVSVLQSGNFVTGKLKYWSTNAGDVSLGYGEKIRKMSGDKIICSCSEGMQIFDITDYRFHTLDCSYGGYSSSFHSVDTSGNYIFFVGERNSSGFIDILLYDADESSSSFSEESQESQSTSSAEYPIYGLTYQNDFRDYSSINNVIGDTNARMQFYGFLDSDWTHNDVVFDYTGYGLSKTSNNHGLIFSNDASKFFSMEQGCVSLVLTLPYDITNGIYTPLLSNTDDYNEYVLWGTNVGQYTTTQPGLYAALTPDGIQFTIWTSKDKFTITDTSTNINANTRALYEFVWDSNELDNYLLRTGIRINNSFTVVGNPPISDDSIENINLCILNTPYLNINYECKINQLRIYNTVPYYIKDDLESSSSAGI